MVRWIAIILLLSFPLQASAALNAHWKLQDNAASTTIVATVGANGTLTNAGNTSGRSVAGPGTLLPLAISFDGADDYVEATTSNTAILQNKSFATLAFWVKIAAADTTGTHRVAYVSTDTSTTTRAGIHFDSTGHIVVSARAGDGESAQSKTSSSSYDDNLWHHVLAVIDYAGDAITIYVDGVAVSATGTISFTASATGNTASARVRIANDATNYTKAYVADVRVYDSNESANAAAIMAEAGVDKIDPLSVSIPGSSKDPLTSTVPGL